MLVDPDGYRASSFQELVMRIRIRVNTRRVNANNARLGRAPRAMNPTAGQMSGQVVSASRGVTTIHTGSELEPDGEWRIHSFTTTITGGGRVSQYTFTVGNDFNAGVMRFCFLANPHYDPNNRHNFQVAAEMLRAAWMNNPNAVAGRTVRGVQMEIEVHFYAHVRGPTAAIREWANDSNMGTRSPLGNDQNAIFFEIFAVPFRILDFFEPR